MTPEADPAVIVVGAGIAGISCARALAKAGLTVQVRDRGHRIGGRMANRTIAGRAVDIGASYFTAHDPDFCRVVDDWQERGLARHWTDTFHLADADGLSGTTTGPVRWAAAGGLRSLVEDLASILDVRYPVEVSAVGPDAQVDGDSAAAVVLAMPDPQALDLLAESAPVAAALDGEWAPSIALFAGWSERRWAPIDGVFVADSPVLKWIADDGRRRGDHAPVLVAHSTMVLAAGYLDDPQRAQPVMLSELLRLLAIDAAPDWVHVKRWSLSVPVSARDRPFLLSGEGPGQFVGVCGDGWGPRARIEGAFLSGRKLGEHLAQRLGG